MWHRLPHALKRVFFGGRRRFCPICEQGSRHFLAFGAPSRPDAQCIWCSSLERHRLFWAFLQQRGLPQTGPAATMLHVAPESCFEPRLRATLGPHYVTADMRPGRADVVMDITRIGYPDESFDRIICSHVLEHVDDDRRAMREFRRLLKPGGEAYLLVPITNGEHTYEDPSITQPRERERAFGQRDHVRRYGRDYVARLRESHFDVQVLTVADLVPPGEAERMGVHPATAGEIFVCRPSSGR